ncbi:MAG: prolipoprotein diacylglyceryl transferase [Magnetococcales bacterium]|nr:prolipoprotein diacylglyceryl transferase [Magnetococcales bacterium]HIJ85322.1 hypothetical protein [Magnetococcales bacterium]
MFPVLYSFGDIHFYTYGFSLFFALMVIYFLCRRAVPGSILSLDNVDDLMLIIIGSLWLGGGLIYLVFSALSGQVDLKNFLAIKTLQQFSVFPVAIATTLAITLWCRWKKLPLIGVLDFLMPFLTIGYGLHRIIGCFSAGCCYGNPTPLPWGVNFPANAALSGPPPGIAIHPTQIYLGLGAFLTWWLLYRFQNALQLPGARTALGLAGLSGFYFIVAFFRADMDMNPGQPGLMSAKLMALAVTLVSTVVLVKLWKKDTDY